MSACLSKCNVVSRALRKGGPGPVGVGDQSSHFFGHHERVLLARLSQITHSFSLLIVTVPLCEHLALKWPELNKQQKPDDLI